jgi:hypothetical protein
VSGGHLAAGKMGKGFGIGALEDMGEEDEDVYDQGYFFNSTKNVYPLNSESNIA